MWDRQPRLGERTGPDASTTADTAAPRCPPGPYSLADLGGDVLKRLDAHGLQRVHYCGLSLGGMVGMWLAVNHPQRIERLVLCNTSAHLNPQAYATRARDVRTAGSLAGVADAVLARWLTPDYAREHPGVADGLRAQLLGTSPEGYAGCCEAIAAMDLRPDLPRIAAPTLCVAGARGPGHPARAPGADRGRGARRTARDPLAGRPPVPGGAGAGGGDPDPRPAKERPMSDDPCMTRACACDERCSATSTSTAPPTPRRR